MADGLELSDDEPLEPSGLSPRPAGSPLPQPLPQLLPGPVGALAEPSGSPDARPQALGGWRKSAAWLQLERALAGRVAERATLREVLSQACSGPPAPVVVPLLLVVIKAIAKDVGGGEDLGVILADETTEMSGSLEFDTLSDYPGALVPGTALALCGVPVLSLAAYSHVLVISSRMLAYAVPPHASRTIVGAGHAAADVRSFPTAQPHPPVDSPSSSDSGVPHGGSQRLRDVSRQGGHISGPIQPSSSSNALSRYFGGPSCADSHIDGSHELPLQYAASFGAEHCKVVHTSGHESGEASSDPKWDPQHHQRANAGERFRQQLEARSLKPRNRALEAPVEAQPNKVARGSQSHQQRQPVLCTGRAYEDDVCHNNVVFEKASSDLLNRVAAAPTRNELSSLTTAIGCGSADDLDLD
eukprot:scaffold262753_cov33-Tisochrysis_lutea.AAC.2